MTQPGLTQISPALVDMLRRSRLDALTQELEETAWDIQDRIGAGDASEDEYRRAFAKARAVAAIGFALDGSLAASFDSLYEAYYAIDSQDDFLRAASTNDYRRTQIAH